MSGLVSFLAGFTFRAFHVMIESSLYLLIGFSAAGALSALVEPAKLRQFFGSGRWTGPIRAYFAAALLLPVCSLGVLPLLDALKRARVRRDAILTFALAASMFNPVSLLYGASYLGAGLLFTLALGSLAIAVIAGLTCGRQAADADVLVPPESEERLAPTGSGRLKQGAFNAARAASGPVLIDISVGIALAGLTAAVLRPSWLADGTFSGDPWAIPLMTVAALPAYVAPEKGIACLPEMLKFRQSSGAMFSLIVLGVGVSGGHFSWIGRSYGAGVLLRWLAVVVTLTLGGAYYLEQRLPPVGTMNIDNDHFEVFANPFDGLGLSNAATKVSQFIGNVDSLHWMTLGAVVCLILSGVMFRMTRLGRLAEPERPSILVDDDPSTSRAKSVLDIDLPRWLVISAASVGTLAAIGVGAFAYYPSPTEAFRDMRIIKADYYGEIGEESPASALHHLDLWDRQVARLRLGALIRFSSRSPDADQFGDELRNGIHLLRKATEEGHQAKARTLFIDVQAIFDRCKQAYHVE